MVAGRVNANGKTGMAFFMFNDYPENDWDATAGRIRPAIRKVLDKDPLYIVFEAESKHPCPEEGTELEGEVRWTSRKYQKPGTKSEANRDDFKLVDQVFGESGKGMMYCGDPGNTTLLRYEMTTKIRRKVFIAGGTLKLLHITLSVKGYGAQDVPLAGMLWDLELSGEIESASQGSAFGIFAPGTAVVTATRSPATQEFTRPELRVNVELNGWIGARDESGAVMFDLNTIASGQEYNEAVDGNHQKLFDFSAVVTYEHPCESKLTAAGTISLDLEGGEVKDLAATVTVYCPGMGKSRGTKAGGSSRTSTPPLPWVSSSSARLSV